MATQITATLPTLDFPLEADYPTQEDWAAFSAAAELNFGILGGSWSEQMQLWKTEANAMSTELNNNADLAQSIANYQGDWTSKGYTLGQSVSVSGVYYICKLTHATGQNPTNGGSLYWNLALGNWNLKVDKVTSTDNAATRFNNINGQIQNSSFFINDISTYDVNNSGLSLTPSNGGKNSIYTYLDSSILELYAGITQKTGLMIYGQTSASGSKVAIRTSGQDTVVIDNNGMTIGSASVGGNKLIAMNSGTLSNGEYAYLNAGGGTTGVINRNALIGVYKHSGIVNACSFMGLSSQSGSLYNYWTDDVGNLRISATNSHIGTTSGTVVGTQTSDERVKNIVGTCPYGLQEILQLETYKYSMKDDVEGSYKLGFVAQQAMGVIPESVYDTNERLIKAVTVIKQKVVKEAVKDEEGNILEPEVLEDYEDIEYQETSDTVTKLAMDYQMMIPVLVNAMKEQQELINSLTARLDRLEGNL